MREQYRRQSFSAWAFWLTLLVGGTLYGARQFEWFSVTWPWATANATPPSSTGPPTASTEATPHPLPPDGQIQVAQSPAGAQTEPPPEVDDSLATKSDKMQSAKARLMVQRTEGLAPKLRANATSPSSVEPANIDDVDMSRPRFDATAAVPATPVAPQKPALRSSGVVPVSNVFDDFSAPATTSVKTAAAATPSNASGSSQVPSARVASSAADFTDSSPPARKVVSPSAADAFTDTQARPRSSSSATLPKAGTEPEPRINPAIDPELASQLRAIDGYLRADDVLRAHRELSTLYWSRSDWRSAIQQRIEKTANAIYFDPRLHFVEPYVVKANDQFAHFAKHYNVPWQYLVKLNRVDPKKLRAGKKLKVIQGPFSAIVEANSFLLTVHAYGYFVRAYPIGIGKDARTPIGKFTVLNKVTNAQYTDPHGRVVDGDDPQNPLGPRWLDLGNSYGIHGTIDPESIGKAESRGCIRMRNEDITEVYDMLGVGSEVNIRR